MRCLIVAIASFGLFTTAVRADDSASPVAGKLPDTADHYHVFLFTLKKNGLSLRMRPKDFCEQMRYGEKVFFQEEDDVEGAVDHKLIVGELDWVICRFPDK
jgi:hypothetical protein